MRIKKLRLPENHVSLAETQHLLGSLYTKKDRHSDSIPMLKSALVAYKSCRDCEVIKSDVLDLLGSAYARIGETGHAILSYEHSLKIKKAIVGREDVACANVLMEIGRLKSAKEDIDGALIAFKEGAFLLMRRVLHRRPPPNSCILPLSLSLSEADTQIDVQQEPSQERRASHTGGTYTGAP